MRRTIFRASLILAVAGATVPAKAQQAVSPHLPFTASLSNTTPLAFGMNTADVARALQAPLSYVRGQPGG